MLSARMQLVPTKQIDKILQCLAWHAQPVFSEGRLAIFGSEDQRFSSNLFTLHDNLAAGSVHRYGIRLRRAVCLVALCQVWRSSRPRHMAAEGVTWGSPLGTSTHRYDFRCFAARMPPNLVRGLKGHGLGWYLGISSISARLAWQAENPARVARLQFHLLLLEELRGKRG